MATSSEVHPHPDFCPIDTLANTPIILSSLCRWLERYPNKLDAELLRCGFESGFRIPFTGDRASRWAGNHKGIIRHHNIVMNKLMEEVTLGRVAGPFISPPLDNLIISPIGLVPKSTPGEFRLIFDLSYPSDNSVNTERTFFNSVH